MDQEKSTSGADARFAAKLREVEEDLAKLRGARDRMVTAGMKAKRAVEEAEDDVISQSSDDGAATVTCNGVGKVQHVILDAAVYNKVSEQQLCGAVLQARQRAWEKARRLHGSVVKRNRSGR